MNILITGRGGSGKSTIHSLLYQRRYRSFDGDQIPGLARAEDLAGNPTTVDWSGYVDYSLVSFNWQEPVLKGFLSTHPNSFLCGSASNQLLFHKLFDMVFVLTLEPNIHKLHLQNRESEYGKEPAMMEYLLADQQRFSHEAVQLGGLAVNANVAPADTLDEILRNIDDLASMAR